MSRRRDADRGRDAHRPPETDLETTRDLVEEVLRTAMALEDVLTALLDELPDRAFPGEDSAHVLLEMIVGSVHPAARAAGPRDCRVATALIGAVRERVIDDLRTAADRARRRETPVRKTEK